MGASSLGSSFEKGLKNQAQTEAPSPVPPNSEADSLIYLPKLSFLKAFLVSKAGPGELEEEGV